DQGIELAAEVAQLLRGDRDHGIRGAEQVDPGGWPGVGGVEPVLGALGELAHIVALQPLESGAGVIVVVAKARVGLRLLLGARAPEAPFAEPTGGRRY